MDCLENRSRMADALTLAALVFLLVSPVGCVTEKDCKQECVENPECLEWIRDELGFESIDEVLDSLDTLAFGVGDDGKCSINAPKIYFFQAQMLGAVPVVEAGDSYERVCRPSDLVDGQQLEGFAIDVELISTARKEQNETNIDNDKSIHVADYINRHYIESQDFTTDHVALTVDCLKKVDNTTLSRECDASKDIMAPNTAMRNVSHVALALRSESWGGGSGDGIGVVVLLDQSGSVNGFVHPDPAEGNKELPYNEASVVITSWQNEQDPAILEKLASDRKQYRIAALDQFASSLNSNDKLLVIAYNEDDKNLLVCAGPELNDPTMADCFATRRDWVQRGLQEVSVDSGGRTPLWEALYNAYEFLEQRDDVVARHIVVLNDGPDTCHPNSEHFASSTPCADKDFHDVVSLVEKDGLPVHVHFVQYEAVGYPARDMAQMEISCLTEGTYSFINRQDMPNTEFESALLKGLDRARYAFLGKWRAIVEMDVVSLNLPWPQGTLAGNAYSIYGHMKLFTNAFVTVESIYKFGVGNQSNTQATQATPNWDNSFVFRKGCSMDSQCSGTDDPDCIDYCGFESRMCYPGGIDAPLGTSCQQGDGTGGLCCGANCQAPDAECVPGS